MKTLILRRLMVLGVVGTIVAGCADMPTAAVPAEPRLNTGTPLNATLTCELYPYGGRMTFYDCIANASGGSGAYVFDWTNATESYTENGSSYARVSCVGSFYSYWIQVSVKVTDSSGASVVVWSEELLCPGWMPDS